VGAAIGYQEPEGGDPVVQNQRMTGTAAARQGKKGPSVRGRELPLPKDSLSLVSHELQWERHSTR